MANYPTFQALLAGMGSPSGETNDVPVPPDASQVNTPGLMTPQERQTLLTALLQPEDVGPAPQVDKPSALALLLSGLGDAVNGFNAGKNRQPGFRSDYTGSYVGRLDQQKADADAYAQRKYAADVRAKERTYNYILRADERAQMAEQEAQGRIELKRITEAGHTADRIQRATDSAAARTQALDVEQARTDRELALNKADNIVRERIANINGGVDKAAARIEKKDLGEAIAFIGKTALNAKAMLTGSNGQPGMTPDQIDNIVRLTLDGLTLTPENRVAADAYFAKEVGPILHEAATQQMNESLAAGSPSQGTSFNLTNWMKARGW